MIRLVFRSASLELLLVAISQNGPMFGWAPPRGGLLWRMEAVALLALCVKPAKL